jgi:hypothetical protein
MVVAALVASAIKRHHLVDQIKRNNGAAAVVRVDETVTWGPELSVRTFGQGPTKVNAGLLQ